MRANSPRPSPWTDPSSRSGEAGEVARRRPSMASIAASAGRKPPLLSSRSPPAHRRARRAVHSSHRAIAPSDNGQPSPVGRSRQEWGPGSKIVSSASRPPRTLQKMERSRQVRHLFFGGAARWNDHEIHLLTRAGAGNKQSLSPARPCGRRRPRTERAEDMTSTPSTACRPPASRPRGGASPMLRPRRALLAPTPARRERRRASRRQPGGRHGRRARAARLRAFRS